MDLRRAVPGVGESSGGQHLEGDSVHGISLLGSDLTPLSFQPFNHGHKVAKFCYADKVSPWPLWGWGAAPLSSCWLQTRRWTSGTAFWPWGMGVEKGQLGVGVPGRVPLTGPGMPGLTGALWELP